MPLALGIHSLTPQPGMAQGGGEVWSRPTTRTPQLALSPLPPEDPRASLPLLALVSGALEAMASTRYQHRTEVDPARGSYRFDCVGLVSWALKQATPQAWASLRETMALSPGRIPSPPTMVRFFAGLARQPQPGSGRCGCSMPPPPPMRTTPGPWIAAP